MGWLQAGYSGYALIGGKTDSLHQYSPMDKKYRIGIDEVGRGPVAGPVSVGIVIMPVEYDLVASFQGTGLTDSKKMSPAARERAHALASDIALRGDIRFGVYSVTAAQIDLRGIEFALRTAVEVGLAKLEVNFNEVEILLDGRLKAPREFLQRSIIGGICRCQLFHSRL